MTLTTGISISGKISVGMWRIANTPRITISIDIITKVYGRRRASWTIHMETGALVYDTAIPLIGNSRACAELVGQVGNLQRIVNPLRTRVNVGAGWQPARRITS